MIIEIHGVRLHLEADLWRPEYEHTTTERDGLFLTEFCDAKNRPIRLVQKPGHPGLLSSFEGKEYLTTISSENGITAFSIKVLQASTSHSTPGIAVLRQQSQTPMDSLLVNTPKDGSGVCARRLHEVLQVGRDFSTWVRNRLEEVGAEIYRDYYTVTGRVDDKRRSRTDYILSLDLAKHFAMVEKTEMGRKVREYFIEVEKRLNVAQVPSIDMNDPLQVAKLYVEAEEQRRKIAARLEIRDKELEQSKVEMDTLIDKIEAPDRCVTFKQFFKETASVLGYSSVTGYRYLRDTGILVKGQSTKWDDVHMVAAEHDRKGFFHVRNVKYPRPVKKDDGTESDNHRYVEVEKPVVYLTRDKKDDQGNIIRIGGYSWLLRKMLKDDRTALSRLIAVEGGPSGKWKALYGRQMVRVRDSLLLESPAPGVINFMKLEDRYAVCAYVEQAKIRKEGSTIQEALRGLIEHEQEK